MTQQTNPNPPLHQTVIDLVNDNATDAEVRLTELEEGESSVIQTLFSGSAGKDEMIRWTPDISTFGEVTVEGYWENTAGVSWRGAITISTTEFLSLAPANSYFQLSAYTEAGTSDSALIGFRETFENGFRVVGFGTYGDNVMVTRVTAKRYTSIIEVSDVSGGQAWSTPADGEPIEPGKGFYSVNAGDTFPVRDTMKDISFIVTDGSDSASADNPVALEIDSALGYTFSDGTTIFEIDVPGASCEFALVDGVWQLVDFGRVLNIVTNGGGGGGGSKKLLFEGNAPVGTVTLDAPIVGTSGDLFIETQWRSGDNDGDIYKHTAVISVSAYLAATGINNIQLNAYTSSGSYNIFLQLTNATANDFLLEGFGDWGLLSTVTKVWQVTYSGNGGNSEQTLWTGNEFFDPQDPRIITITTIGNVPWTDFDEVVIQWEDNSQGFHQNVFTSYKPADLALSSTSRVQLKWLGGSEGVETGGWLYFEFSQNGVDTADVQVNTSNAAIGQWRAPTFKLLKITGKRQAKVYRDVELTETANTWTETQTFAKPIENSEPEIRHNLVNFRATCSDTSPSFSQIPFPDDWTIVYSGIPGVWNVTHPDFGKTIRPVVSCENSAWTAAADYTGQTSFDLKVKNSQTGVGEGGQQVNGIFAY